MLDFSYEQNVMDSGARVIVGVDEVGRGPWAGPVVAAAVLLDPANLPTGGAMDSKKLTAKKREVLHAEIMEKAQVSIAEATVEEIDRFNIREATFLAMERAVAGLNLDRVDHIAIDGNAIPRNLPQEAQKQCVVKGDDKVLSIACASIVAKVYRDNLMAELGEVFPQYGWAKNAGYGTKQHQEGLAEIGVCDHHRRSFAPIRKMLEERA